METNRYELQLRVAAAPLDIGRENLPTIAARKATAAKQLHGDGMKCSRYKRWIRRIARRIARSGHGTNQFAARFSFGASTTATTFFEICIRHDDFPIKLIRQSSRQRQLSVCQ